MSSVATRITNFVNANRTKVIIGVVAVAAIIGYIMYSRQSPAYPPPGVGQAYMMGGAHREGFNAQQMVQMQQGQQRPEYVMQPGNQGPQVGQYPQGKQGGEDVKRMVLFYAPWCPHCKDLLQPNDKNGGKPAWDLLKRKHSGRKDVVIDEIDCEAKPELASKYEVKGFPTVVMLKGNQKVDYDGDRSLESLEKFMDTA